MLFHFQAAAPLWSVLLGFGVSSGVGLVFGLWPALKAAQKLQPFFTQAEKVEHIDTHTQIRLSQNGQIATTTLPMTVPGWEMTKDQGKQLIDAAEANDGNGLQIKLGGDPIYAAQSSSRSSPRTSAIARIVSGTRYDALGRPR